MPAAGADPGTLVGGLRDRLLAAFPGEIRSLYLVGSRALGCEIGTSDIDLAVLFHGEATAERRRAVERWVEGAAPADGPALEVAVLDPADLERGLRPHLQIARLLAGEDVCRGRPLKPAETLRGYYVHLALYFIWAVRGRPAKLSYPLAYPAEEGEFYGYERHGLRLGENRYGPGFSQLVNDVNCLATFRLAQRSEFIPNKSLVAAAFARAFPDDRWGDLVAGVFELGRTRWQGRVPPEGADRRRLADYCRRMLEFENETLAACLPLLPGMAVMDDPEIRRRVRGILGHLDATEPAAAAALAAARAPR
jgi:hypothetical protein